MHSQPLIYARLEHGKLQHSSVDHISNIVKRAKDRHMGNMMTAHVRGASVSKIVQLVPDLTEQALALGRWTTPHTFCNHYQAPVMGTWAPVPNSIEHNPQQVLRCGWTPTPPDNVSVAEYEKLPRYWVGRTIPLSGKVDSFDNGDCIIWLMVAATNIGSPCKLFPTNDRRLQFNKTSWTNDHSVCTLTT
jgi:hypothetical protein